MISVFLKKVDKVSYVIIESLNRAKMALLASDYSVVHTNYSESIHVIGEIQRKAIDDNDEELANACTVFRLYFSLFDGVASFLEIIEEQKYRESWDVLQGCISTIITLERFTEIEEKYEIPELRHILETYESLYPYKIFFSEGYVVKKSSCNICHQSMRGLHCNHRRGQLYWGKFAMEIIEDIDLYEISIVDNPKDKKKVVELSGRDYSYEKLNAFLNLNLHKLSYVEIESEFLYDKSGMPYHETIVVKTRPRTMKMYRFHRRQVDFRAASIYGRQKEV